VIQRWLACVFGLLVGAAGPCSPPSKDTPTPTSTSTSTPTSTPTSTSTRIPTSTSTALTLHFYDVGQGLAVLADLPDGRRVLVDTGDRAARQGCGDSCAAAERHLLDRLRADLHGDAVDVLWITHPHSDHVGAAADVLDSLPVRMYVDNGRDLRRSDVARARGAAQAHGVPIRVVDPEHADWPAPAASSRELTLTPIVPPAWLPACAHDANECSIGLRIDYGASSVLLTGDAEHAEEATLDTHGPAVLLQVAHHGSDTSTTPGFLARVRPRYAVISAGKPDVGLNREYCHPRAIVAQRLTRLLGGPGRETLSAFDGDRCESARPSDWIAVPASDRLWATERDGDVVLTTNGDGEFRRR
jgi:competence protein ComEC